MAWHLFFFYFFFYFFFIFLVSFHKGHPILENPTVSEMTALSREFS